MGLGRGGNAQIKGPAAVDRAGIAAWMAEMQAMKKACQEAIGFDGSAFEVPSKACAFEVKSRHLRLMSRRAYVDHHMRVVALCLTR